MNLVVTDIEMMIKSMAAYMMTKKISIEGEEKKAKTESWITKYED